MNAHARYGGLGGRQTMPESLSTFTSDQLRKAVIGCTHGARLAWSDSADQDFDWMLNRIVELATELASRTPDFRVRSAQQRGSGRRGKPRKVK